MIHAAIDWDWQMPAVTLVALFCAGGIVVAVKDDRAERLRLASPWRVGRRHCRYRPRVGAFVGLRGNQEIAGSQNAAAASNWSASAQRGP